VIGLLLFVAIADVPTGRVVDLSHPFDAQTIYWPTEPGFVLEKEHAGPTPGGWYYAANRFSAPEHGGTHIDAPLHFAEGKHAVDQIPVEQLMGPAVVIEGAGDDADRLIQRADFERFERAHGPIPPHAIVLLRTGWSRRWPDRPRYLGTDERGPGAVAKLHFPGLDPEAARWLLRERQPKAVGIDTASIDYGQSKTYETHRALFAADVPAFENLTRLDELPPTGAYVVALPMKIAGGSGAPLRAIAIIPQRR
jgi:kynurenine formamidase